MDTAVNVPILLRLYHQFWWILMIYVDMVSRMFTYIESEETLNNIVQIKRY